MLRGAAIPVQRRPAAESQFEHAAPTRTEQRPWRTQGFQPPRARLKSKARPTSGRCSTIAIRASKSARRLEHHAAKAQSGGERGRERIELGPDQGAVAGPRGARLTKSELGGRATRDRAEPSTNQLRPPSGGLMGSPRSHEPHSRLTPWAGVSTIAGQTPALGCARMPPCSARTSSATSPSWLRG